MSVHPNHFNLASSPHFRGSTETIVDQALRPKVTPPIFDYEVVRNFNTFDSVDTLHEKISDWINYRSDF